MIFFVFQNAHYIYMFLCIIGHPYNMYIYIYKRISNMYIIKNPRRTCSNVWKKTTFLQESQDFQRHWKQTLHACLDRSYHRHGSWISEPSITVLVSDRRLSQQLPICFCNFEPTVSWCPEINTIKYDLKLMNHIWSYDICFSISMGGMYVR